MDNIIKPGASNTQNRHNPAASSFIILLLMTIALSMSGCTRLSPENFYREARLMKLEKHTLQAGQFPVVYYSRPQTGHIPHLHLYLGGDGLPWRGIMTYSEDPTPRNPLVLRLMQQDSTPSLYLGRPCYQGFATTPPCNYRLWTSARYSSEVLQALTLAIKQLVSLYRVRDLTLIGYSGGGTIATLIAANIPQVHTVVTIAGDLDTDAWVKYHGYSPLSESLNPALRPPLPGHIRQIHLQGKRDRNIPPVLSARFLKHQHQPLILTYPEADHTCCWQDIWTDALKQVHKSDIN